MLHTTRAVVLRMVKYGDRSVILNAYTEQFGARSYLMRPAPKGKQPPLAALDRVELVVNEDPRRDVQHVRECRVERPYLHVAREPARGILLLFFQEVFCRTLKEEASDPVLFAYVLSALEELDLTDDLPHYPLLLLVRLSRHLGFLPEPPRPGEDRFDLREGRFFHGACEHGEFLGPATAGSFARLLAAEKGEVRTDLAPAARTAVLAGLLDLYRLHVPGFGQLRSPAVLHDILG